MRRGTHTLGRPVVLSSQERTRLDAIAGLLDRKGFKADAGLVREIGLTWDQMDQFVVVHRAAVATRPDPNGEIVTERSGTTEGTARPAPDAAQSSTASTHDANGAGSTSGATSRPGPEPRA